MAEPPVSGMGCAPAGMGPPAPGNAPAGRLDPDACFVAVFVAAGWVAFDDVPAPVLVERVLVGLPGVCVLADAVDVVVSLDAVVMLGVGVDVELGAAVV